LPKIIKKENYIKIIPETQSDIHKIHPTGRSWLKLMKMWNIVLFVNNTVICTGKKQLRKYRA
jgi:hypothetical protein